jgi:hypothetical protein
VSVIPEQLRADVVARAWGRCEYCLFLQEWSLGEFEVDHVIPRSQGGPTALDNLALACPLCNAHKWAHQQGRDTATGETVPLFNPRTQVWHEHFQWSTANPFEIEGITPCGRATVAMLYMNHPRVVALRQLLSEMGVPIKPVT